MPGRQVRDAHGRVRDVDVLAAGAARAVGVDAEVLVGDLDLDVLVDLGRHVDGSERGVPPLRRVEGRDPHQPVDAHLALQVSVGVVPDDVERGALDARLLAVLPLDELGLPAARLGEAHVHPQKHLGPVLGLRAAGARVDRQPGVLGVLGRAHLDGELELVGERRRPPRATRARPRRPARLRAGARRAPRARPGGRRDARRVSSFFSKARVWRRISCASSGRDQKSGRRRLLPQALERAPRGVLIKDSPEAPRGAPRRPSREETRSSRSVMRRFACPCVMRRERPRPRRARPKISTASAASVGGEREAGSPTASRPSFAVSRRTVAGRRSPARRAGTPRGSGPRASTMPEIPVMAARTR